jgi:hypothetical protein
LHNIVVVTGRFGFLGRDLITCPFGEKEEVIAIDKYIRISFRSDCQAEATDGYRFGSWTQNLGGGSSKTVSASATSSALPSGFFEGLFGLNQRDISGTYQIPDFGNYSVNFNQQSSTQIPPEYLSALSWQQVCLPAG